MKSADLALSTWAMDVRDDVTHAQSGEACCKCDDSR